MDNKIVVYFGATGSTRKVASKLANEQNATLYEIKPKEKYTASDLDWRKSNR